jgi:uncharacterized membrane protein YgdD (TMEM256/DUF423 family)
VKIVPIGGSLLIVGWACLVIAVLRLERRDSPKPSA